MSKAIKCDRCKQFSDSPQRAYVDFVAGSDVQMVGEMLRADLCQACRLDLMDWLDAEPRLDDAVG